MDEDKAAYVTKVYPQVSSQGQESLENLANAMLALQSTPPPISSCKRQAAGPGGDDGKKPHG
jgi:hypothetical protein